MKPNHKGLVVHLDRLLINGRRRWTFYEHINCEILAGLWGYSTDNRYLTKTFKPKLRKLFKDAGYNIQRDGRQNYLIVEI